MFVILLNYVKPLAEIDTHLQAHRAFLDEGYASGIFIASGPRVPRTGGIILAKAESVQELQNFVSKDPLQTAGVAEYEILEFTPLKSDPRLKDILK
jgi:uncharacterized protein YciI